MADEKLTDTGHHPVWLIPKEVVHILKAAAALPETPHEVKHAYLQRAAVEAGAVVIVQHRRIQGVYRIDIRAVVLF